VQGYEAFEFVRDQLAKAPFVMLKTHQIDIYGRYLNQELLDKGLANRA